MSIMVSRKDFLRYIRGSFSRGETVKANSWFTRRDGWRYEIEVTRLKRKAPTCYLRISGYPGVSDATGQKVDRDWLEANCSACRESLIELVDGLGIVKRCRCTDALDHAARRDVNWQLPAK